MNNMKLSYFTNDDDFPFYIGYGEHNEDMFIHGHDDFYELVIVVEGTAIHNVNGDEYEISKGDVFAVGKNICHGYTNPNNFRICNIMFKPNFFISSNFDIKKLSGFHALFLLEPHINSHKFESRLKLSYKEFNNVKSIIENAIKEYKSEADGNRTMVISYFIQIAVLLSRLYNKTDKKREIQGVSESAAFIENNYNDDISINALVEISHYSQRHFIRLFTEIYGVSPHRYLIDIRLRKACNLLKETDLSITDIAGKCGFSEPNYFTRIFRKYVGYTPIKFRNTK